MTSTSYKNFVRRWEEVMELPPQTVGPLTPLYKILVKRLKVMPWPMLMLGALFMVIGAYVVFGSALTLLVSVLQRGF